MNEHPSNIDVLLTRNIPSISPELERAVTHDALHAQFVEYFDPRQAQAALVKHEGDQVTAYDIGGQKVARQEFQVQDGVLVPITDIEVQRGVKGNTYLPFMRDSAPTSYVGVSCAGYLDGTVLHDSPNAPIFTKSLQKGFEGDFAKLFPSAHVVLCNDAVGGLKATSIAAMKKNPQIKNIGFIIDGGGFGLAALTNNMLIASEPGHLPVPADLNPFDHESPCNVAGAKYTCVEKVAASGAGVEHTYYQLTGKKLDGRDISYLYQLGDVLATGLYDASAIAMAQVVFLEEKLLEFQPEETMLVYHGGGFEVPGYPERFTQLLTHYMQRPQQFFKSGDVFENAGLTGIAIAALLHEY